MGRLAVAPMLCLSAALVAALATASSADPMVGWWRITDEVQSTSYQAFRGLRVVYRVKFRQEGAWLFGEGRKVGENGRPLPASRQKPIAIVGTIAGSFVTATLFEEGHRRDSGGEFRWTLSDDGRRLAGTFQSDAADSSGSSVAEFVGSAGE